MVTKRKTLRDILLLGQSSMYIPKIDADRAGEAAFPKFRGIRPYFSKARERVFGTHNDKLSTSHNLTGSNFDLKAGKWMLTGGRRLFFKILGVGRFCKNRSRNLLCEKRVKVHKKSQPAHIEA